MNTPQKATMFTENLKHVIIGSLYYINAFIASSVLSAKCIHTHTHTCSCGSFAIIVIVVVVVLLILPCSFSTRLQSSPFWVLLLALSYFTFNLIHIHIHIQTYVEDIRGFDAKTELVRWNDVFYSKLYWLDDEHQRTHTHTNAHRQPPPRRVFFLVYVIVYAPLAAHLYCVIFFESKWNDVRNGEYTFNLPTIPSKFLYVLGRFLLLLYSCMSVWYMYRFMCSCTIRIFLLDGWCTYTTYSHHLTWWLVMAVEKSTYFREYFFCLAHFLLLLFASTGGFCFIFCCPSYVVLIYCLHLSYRMCCLCLPLYHSHRADNNKRTYRFPIFPRCEPKINILNDLTMNNRIHKYPVQVNHKWLS